jgi:ribosomal protein S18 acetylase RimI-like enzyme
LAHGGFSEALYEDLDMPVAAILESELADMRSMEHFSHYRVAVDGDTLAGGLSAFAYDEQDPDIDHPGLPRERLLLETPFDSIQAPGSYFIHAITVFAEFRRRGIGSMLMSLARKQAIAQGFSKLSLYVFAENSAAMALYRKHGYLVQGRSRLIPHPRLRYTGDVLLMTCAIDEAGVERPCRRPQVR